MNAHPGTASQYTPEVSVVMGVHNGAADVAMSIGSILDQQDCTFELIVVDDGSTDETPALLQSLAARHPRMRVLSQPNEGLTRSLIRACAQAQGELIARQDAGDLSLPGRLARQAQLLRHRPEVAIASCWHALVGPEGEPLSLTSGAARDEEPVRHRDGTQRRSPAHGTVMFRRSIYEQVGGYRPDFYFAQDVDLWSRMTEHGELAFVPDTLYRLKFSLSGITASHRASQEKLRALIARCSAARAAGDPEEPFLRLAAEIRPRAPVSAQAGPPRQSVDAAYFVASCLLAMRDPRARKYLWKAIELDPLHLKSWFKLLGTAWLPSR